MAWNNFTISENIFLELAQASDARQIALMSRDLVEAGLGWSWTPDRVARHIRSPKSLVIVARNRQTLVGFAIMQFSKHESHLNLLAVQPLFQRCGVGRHLVEFLERCMWFSNVSVIHLEVRARNRSAREFYRSLGYQEVSMVPHYYQGRESAIRLVHQLQMSYGRV